MADRELVILLAEDDEGHAYLVQQNLLDAGLVNRIVHVPDGQEALDYLVARRRLSSSVYPSVGSASAMPIASSPATPAERWAASLRMAVRRAARCCRSQASRAVVGNDLQFPRTPVPNSGNSCRGVAATQVPLQ